MSLVYFQERGENEGPFWGTSGLAGGRQKEIRSNPADIGQAVAPLSANGFNIPSLQASTRRPPTSIAVLAQTLEEVLNGSQDTLGGVRHLFVASAADRADPIAFLRSIDE